MIKKMAGTGTITESRVVGLHTGDPGSVPVISYGPLRLPGLIPECTDRNNYS